MLFDDNTLALFWAKVDKNGPIPDYCPDLGPCWIWLASCYPYGYGQFGINRKGIPRRSFAAHRITYELIIGPIPDRTELDHLCRNPPCCNPEHLEPVTHQVNCQRGDVGHSTGARNKAKTHCPQGHAYDSANTYLYKDTRQCRICRLKRLQNSRARRSG